MLLIKIEKLPLQYSYSLQRVGFNNMWLDCLVTHSATMVEHWIAEVVDSHTHQNSLVPLERRRKQMFGLRFETPPPPSVNPIDLNIVPRPACLQLSTSMACLLFSLCHGSDVPESLVKLFKDSNNIFVGVNIFDDLEYVGLDSKNVVDMHKSLAAITRKPELEKSDLFSCASQFFGTEIKMPSDVLMTHWGDEDPNKEEVKWAAMGAYFALKTGQGLAIRGVL